MSYVKKTWGNGDDVTPEDFNRIEQGIKDNEDKINVLDGRIKSTIVNFNDIGNKVMVNKSIVVNSGDAVYINLPLDYVGFMTIYSPTKGEYFETYLMQIKNKWAYKATSVSSERFNNTADEIFTEFVPGADSDDDFAYLVIKNNTALNGTFEVTLTQNQKG